MVLPKKRRKPLPAQGHIAILQFWCFKAPFQLLSVAINLGNVDKKVKDTAGVTPLVVVPGNELDEVLVEGDTSLGVEDGRAVVAVQVSGDNVILSVTENACGC